MLSSAAPPNVFSCLHARLDFYRVVNVVLNFRRALLEILEAQIFKADIFFDRKPNRLRGNSVRRAKRNAFFYEIVRQIRGVQKSARTTFAHFFRVEFRRGNHIIENCDTTFHRVERGKKRLFVFLQIAVITERKAFHHRKQIEKRAVNFSGASANQFCEIRIFFLRHNRRACGPFFRKRNKIKFTRRPQNDFFAEARKMHLQNGKRRRKFNAIVAVGNAVH